MIRRTLAVGLSCVLGVLPGAMQSLAQAADFEFFGRSGDAIELDFSSRQGVPGGANFGPLSLAAFAGHTTLTSGDLGGADFSSTGQLWLFANPQHDNAAAGDADAAARGFQGRLEGSVEIDGQQRTFAVTVRPGYTAAGRGAVEQSLERINRSANNRLFVAQQQQRLRHLGFVPEGGGLLAVDGDFGALTDDAVRTFQAAFVAGNNTTQADVDGIVGPNTAGWLNAANAPTWDELIDPDPQRPGSFSVAGIRGDWDILPARDPGTGARTGLTPQAERFGTNWAINLWSAGAADAHAATGLPQLMNAMSTDDGYGSAAVHNTHRAGMDVDMHVDGSTHNFGNGVVSAAEQAVIDVAVAFIDAGVSGDSQRGRVRRFIVSNQDIFDGIRAARPAVQLYYDASGGHRNHLHLDVDAPARVAGTANLAGDFDLTDAVDGGDFLAWQRGWTPAPVGAAELATWQDSFGAIRTAGPSTTLPATPEPSTALLIAIATLGLVRLRVKAGRTQVHRSLALRVTVFLAVLGTYDGTAIADGLVYQLPDDGSWARFAVAVEGEFGIDAGPAQKVQFDSQLTVSSVGKSVRNEQACRWIELKFETKASGAHPKLLLKILVPEERLQRGHDPFSHVVLTFFNPKPVDTEGLQSYIDDGFNRVQYEIDRFRDVFPKPLSLAVPAVRETIKTPVGKFENCEIISGTSEYDGPVLGDGRSVYQAKYRIALHPDAPFGVVSMHLEAQGREYGGSGVAAHLKVTKTLTLADTGVDAHSELASPAE